MAKRCGRSRTIRSRMPARWDCGRRPMPSRILTSSRLKDKAACHEGMRGYRGGPLPCIRSLLNATPIGERTMNTKLKQVGYAGLMVLAIGSAGFFVFAKDERQLDADK